MIRNFLVLLLVLTVSHFGYAQNGNDYSDNINLLITPDQLKISLKDEPVMIYNYRSVPAKPYVQWLTSPNGVNILRDAPSDHLHHHGLMFALRVNDIDFWIENKNSGQQSHLSFDGLDAAVKNKQEQTCFTEIIDWVGPSSDKKILKEERTLSLEQTNEATVLTWKSSLKPINESRVLINGNHYFGLGMRFADSMGKPGVFINADDRHGEVVRGTEKLIQSRWCAYQTNIDGKSVTVAMFEHPDNSNPVTWFIMTEPFSYLSATLQYHKNNFSLNSEDEFTLKYVVVVWDGIIDKDTINNFYNTWLNKQGVSFKKSN